MSEPPERPPITHVAIRFQGRTWSLPRPYRHHHVLRTIMWLSKEFGEYTKDVFDSVDARRKDQGFLDESGQYLDRKQALMVAQSNGQMREDRPVWGDELYSENVW